MTHDWSEMAIRRMEEMSTMDPEMPLRIGKTLEVTKLLKAVSALLGVFTLITLACAVPVVILLWRAAL